MKICIVTLGCKVNQYESQALETYFASRGYEISAVPENCDAVILNSCAVTAESVRKSRQTLRKLKSDNPGAAVAVCGCWPQTEPDNAEAIGADVIFGSSNRMAMAKALIDALEEKRKTVSVDDAMKRRAYESLPAGNLLGRTRALLKIEDGCTNFCSYCIIPYARGPVRSLPLEQVEKEARSLGEKGYREIVITGIEVASYGRDLKGVTFADAIVTAANAAPDARIRLGSLEPRVIDDEFCERLAALPNLCRHFHLSLQSGCDATLKRMNRKYDTARFYESVSLLRKYFDNCGITTDLITGFPGETEEEFAETLAFIEKCAFTGMHIFPYSVRKGTVAEKMDGQVSRSEKAARAKRAATVAERMKDGFLRRQIGKTLDVLFETPHGEMWQGHSGNYCVCSAPGAEMKNRVAKVLITSFENGVLFGKIVM